ncbi:MAG: serine hydrolase domain-containing protein, partial [Longimicrobiales bacterium]
VPFLLKRCGFLVVSLGLLLPGESLPAQRTTNFSALEKTIQAELSEAQIPGAAIAIVSGDRIVFSRGFGISNAESGAPVLPEMVFRIGSVTKMFTAAALTMLAEQDKLSLDAHIGQYLKNLSPGLANVTAHQLMSHTAGLRDDAPSFGAHDPETMSRVVRAWRDEYFFTQPGRVFSYSNPGMTLAGLLAQEASGKPFHKLLDDLLFKPLSMTSSTFEPTLAMTYPLAQGHNVTDGRAVVVRPFADNAGYWPAGFLFSSVRDLARFTIAFMNAGRIDGLAVIPTTVIAKLSGGYAPTQSGPDGSEYGYGLQSREYRGVRVVEHGGSIQGFGALVRMVPEQQFAFIVLTNRSGGQLPKSADAALEMFLPLHARTEAKAAQTPITQADLAGLPGTYAQGQNRIEIAARDGKLILRQGATELPLQKISDLKFAVDVGQRREFVVVRGANGRVEYLHTGLRALARQQ